MHFDNVAVDSRLRTVAQQQPALLMELLGMQGFASGDLERDAQAVRLFTDAGLELLLSQVGLDARSMRNAPAPKSPVFLA